jgi:hypothetical protein
VTIYGDHAIPYTDAGWEIFPLPAGAKSPPPRGRTGRNGRTPSREEIAAEAVAMPDRNIGARVTGGLIGIDVDAYDGKPGGMTLASLVEELGPLPATVISTSRDDGISGIRFYRVPADVKFVTKLPGIEICQTHHRYAVVWPSTHEKTGREYEWINSYTWEPWGSIPMIEDLPELPAAWLERLKIGTESNAEKADVAKTEIDTKLSEWCPKDDGRPCVHLTAVIEEARDEVRRGNTRHDSCMQAQLSIIRYAEAGHVGGRTALSTLKTWFFEVMDGDRDVRDEWRNGITGATRTVLAEPTPADRRGCDQDMEEDEEILFGLDQVRRADPKDQDRDGRSDASPSPDTGGDSDDGEDTDDQPEGDEIPDAGRGRDGRVRINVGNKERAGRQLRLMIGTGELSGLFYREGEIVYCPRIGERGYVPAEDGDDDGPAQVRIMQPIELKTLIEITYACGQGRNRNVTVTGADGEETTVERQRWEPKMFPMEAATHVHTAARSRNGTPNLRRLNGVTHTPIMRADGTVMNTPGYDRESCMLYLPERGLIVPDLPSPFGREDVGAAVGFLKEIVREFPFVEDHHRANWFGALFTPLMRVMLPPPYPAFVIDAPSPGAGKSYLAGIIRTVHGGVIRAGWPSDDAEFGKVALATLIGTTAPVVTFDNVRGKIRSAKFEALLTSPIFTDRLLGVSRDANAANDRLWTITANNAEIGGDLARRCYWITIDPRMPRPHERTGFSLDLRTWPVANRGRIIAAMLTVVRGWVLAGMPKADLKRSDDFATWDAAMEGLLSWAGFTGQFGRPDEAKQESDDDREWLVFLSSVHAVFGTREFKIRDLVSRLKDSDGDSPFTPEPGTVEDKIDPSCLPGELADKWSRTGLGSPAGFTKSLGRWVKHRSGRFAGDLTLKVTPNNKKGDLYQITEWK